MILLDTSGLLAAIDADQPHHGAAARLLATKEPRILSPFVLAELDYLLAAQVGQEAELALLEEVGRGAYQLALIGSEDVRNATALIEQYATLGLGLADASLFVLAQRYGCLDILTLDERHFRAVLGPGGKPFRLLPADD